MLKPIADNSQTITAGIEFWRENPKISTLPEQAVMVGEQPAWRVRFQSLTRAARLDVLLDPGELRRA